MYTENIQTSDLTAVAKLGDQIVLFVRNEDVDNPNAEAIQYNFGLQEYHIGLCARFCKFTPFEPIDPSSTLQRYYRNLIYRNLPMETFVHSLIDFTPVDQSFKSDIE